jgi:hypothetical protein
LIVTLIDAPRAKSATVGEVCSGGVKTFTWAGQSSRADCKNPAQTTATDEPGMHHFTL